jgi:hypothetical protein
MIFFEDSDRIFENENALLKKGGNGFKVPRNPAKLPVHGGQGGTGGRGGEGFRGI